MWSRRAERSLSRVTRSEFPQEGKSEYEQEIHELRVQLGTAGHVLMASAVDMKELQARARPTHVRPGSKAHCFLPPQACALRLKMCLSAARDEAEALRETCNASAMRATNLEGGVATLRAELAASRESNEALRRDLRMAQADGEGRARELDVSARDLRKELRECDETIG